MEPNTSISYSDLSHSSRPQYKIIPQKGLLFNPRYVKEYKITPKKGPLFNPKYSQPGLDEIDEPLRKQLDPINNLVIEEKVLKRPQPELLPPLKQKKIKLSQNEPQASHNNENDPPASEMQPELKISLNEPEKPLQAHPESIEINTNHASRIFEKDFFSEIYAPTKWDELSLETDEVMRLIDFADLFAAASKGDAEAQNKLGHSQQYGIDTEINLEEAVRNYRKAANQGHTDAQYNLGVCLQKGIGIQPDHLHALHLFNEAAKKGHPQANIEINKPEMKNLFPYVLIKKC